VFVSLLSLYIANILWPKLRYHIDISKHSISAMKFCHERYFLMYFVDIQGSKTHLEKFGK